NHGVKVVISIENNSSEEFYNFLLDSHARKTFYNQLDQITREYMLDGVNINFEHLPVPSRNTMLNDFLLEMHILLSIINPGAEVSFTGPAINAGGWDFTGLAAACDYIFIMGYDFKGGWSDHSGPSAPLTGGYYNLTRTLKKEYEDVVATHPEKLILGIPYYGNKWLTNSREPRALVVEHARTYRYRDLIDEAQYYGILWDSISQTPWYIIEEDNKIYQVWFDNRESLALKYDLADTYDIKGVGIWALGYDRDYTELWDELRLRYLDTSSKHVSVFDSQTTTLIYPNPFDNEAKLNFKAPVEGVLTLRVFDNMGKQQSIRQFDYGQPGNPSTYYLGSDLSNGNYFVKMVFESEQKLTKQGFKILKLR
ncbi:MAG: T9SS type A sorting domain-containing protein, partial [Bacteroidales bacterium]|nr:T9SS type A sorting domain-containing protein [Bacteroidales bacterium]